jgi:hypothetical protein
MLALPWKHNFREDNLHPSIASKALKNLVTTLPDFK